MLGPFSTLRRSITSFGESLSLRRKVRRVASSSSLVSSFASTCFDSLSVRVRDSIADAHLSLCSFLSLLCFLTDEEEEESDEEEGSDQGEELFPSAPPADGLETPSGTQSIVSTVPGGLETPEFLDIRKERELSSRAGTESVESSAAPAAPKQLYQVIEERQTNVRGFMGSERGYDVHGAGNVGPRVLGQEERGTKVRRFFLSRARARRVWVFVRVFHVRTSLS